MNTPRKKLDNERDGRAALADWESSNLDLRAFCKLRNLDGRQLRAWQRRLGDESTSTPLGPVRLVECDLARPSTYRIRTERFEVEVEDGFRDDTLRRLLRLVGEAA